MTVLQSGGNSDAPHQLAVCNAPRSEADSVVTAAENVVAPADDASGTLTGENAVLLLLRECGSWWKINGKRTGLAWSFLVPSNDHVLETAVKGLVLPKQHSVCCWLCYFEQYGKLHKNYPVPPDSDEGLERKVDEALSCLDYTQYLDFVDRSSIMSFEYKHTSGSTNLRNHVSKHHGKWYSMLQPTEEGTESVATQPKKRPVAILSSLFKPVKRLKDEEPRQQLFLELLTYVIVFLRWSFSVVDNPWFRAFVWFLDATVSIPSRKQWQIKHLAKAVKTSHESIMNSLKGVVGVSVMFDLWMSRKGGYLVCSG